MKLNNRKFNNECLRFRFWNSLEQHFLGFHGLLNPNEKLTSEDRIALFEIHTLIFKCYQIAKEKGKFHSDKVLALIGRCPLM